MKKIFILLFTSLTFIFPIAYYADDTTDSILIRTVDSTEAVQHFNNTLKENWGMVSAHGFGENSYIGNPFTVQYQWNGAINDYLFHFPIITNSKAINYVQQQDYEENGIYGWAVSEWAFSQENMNKLKTGKVYSIIEDKNYNILAVSDDNEVIVLLQNEQYTGFTDDGEPISKDLPPDYDPPYEGIDTVVVDIMAPAENIDTSPIIPQTEEEKAVIEDARKNGKPYSLVNTNSIEAIIENGRLLIPLRNMAEHINCEVDWDPKEKTAYLIKDGTIVKFIIGSSQYYINDEIHYLDTPAKIYNGKTYIPFRSAGDALGINIAYNPHTKNIVFSY